MADMLIMYAVEALIIMPATRESSEDLREGLEAFGAKRKPRFRGNDAWRGDSRSLRGVAADGGPRVRIHLPPVESQRTFGTARSGPPMAHPGQHVHRGAAIDHPQPTHDPTGVIDT